MCFVCICIRICLHPGLLYGRGQLYWDAHWVQPLSAPSAFPSIYLDSLSFSLSKKLLTLITTFFKSDDIAFLFGILTACDTRCHWYSPLYMFSGGSVTRLWDQLTCNSWYPIGRFLFSGGRSAFRHSWVQCRSLQKSSTFPFETRNMRNNEYQNIP